MTRRVQPQPPERAGLPGGDRLAGEHATQVVGQVLHRRVAGARLRIGCLGDDGFEVRSVQLGRRSEQFAEILSGVSPSELIAITGTFSLKAELQKGEFDDGHAH